VTATRNAGQSGRRLLLSWRQRRGDPCERRRTFGPTDVRQAGSKEFDTEHITADGIPAQVLEAVGAGRHEGDGQAVGVGHEIPQRRTSQRARAAIERKSSV